MKAIAALVAIYERDFYSSNYLRELLLLYQLSARSIAALAVIAPLFVRGLREVGEDKLCTPLNPPHPLFKHMKTCLNFHAFILGMMKHRKYHLKN